MSDHSSIDLVHVIGALAAGGAERFVIDLVRGLSERGWNIRVLALSARSDATREAMESQLTSTGVAFGIGPSARLGIRTVLWYGRQLARYRPMIVHLHTANTEFAHALAIPWHHNRPLLVRTLHNTRLSLGLRERIAMRSLPVTRSIACGDAAGQGPVPGLLHS